jgi:hypothetical protein
MSNKEPPIINEPIELPPLTQKIDPSVKSENEKARPNPAKIKKLYATVEYDPYFMKCRACGGYGYIHGPGGSSPMKCTNCQGYCYVPKVEKPQNKSAV